MSFSVHVGDDCSARMDFNIILEPVDRDVVVGELQLKTSCLTLLYSLVL